GLDSSEFDQLSPDALLATHWPDCFHGQASPSKQVEEFEHTKNYVISTSVIRTATTSRRWTNIYSNSTLPHIGPQQKLLNIRACLKRILLDFVLRLLRSLESTDVNLPVG